MTAPLAVLGAKEAAAIASKALTGDIVRVGTTYFAVREVPGKGRKKKRVLVPVDVEAHFNPLSIGLGAAALGAAALLGVIAYDGVQLATPFGTVQVFRGLKDVWDEVRPPTLQKETRCDEIERAYRTTSANCAEGSESACIAARYYLARGKHLGCPWAR